FRNRTPHMLDGFEKQALATLRADPNQLVTEVSDSLFSDRVRLIAPVTMGAACVSCHNAHAETPKRDWKVGDGRGVQEVTITQPFAATLFSFKYLLIYFVLMAATGITFIVLQRRQELVISGMNREHGTGTQLLAPVLTQ